MREVGSDGVPTTELDRIVSLPLEIRGESLYDESIEVVLNGFRYQIE